MHSARSSSARSCFLFVPFRTLDALSCMEHCYWRRLHLAWPRSASEAGRSEVRIVISPFLMAIAFEIISNNFVLSYSRPLALPVAVCQAFGLKLLLLLVCLLSAVFLPSEDRRNERSSRSNCKLAGRRHKLSCVQNASSRKDNGLQWYAARFLYRGTATAAAAAAAAAEIMAESDSSISLILLVDLVGLASSVRCYCGLLHVFVCKCGISHYTVISNRGNVDEMGNQ